MTNSKHLNGIEFFFALLNITLRLKLQCHFKVKVTILEYIFLLTAVKHVLTVFFPIMRILA